MYTAPTKVLSLDIRQRIITCRDEGGSTLAEIAERFRVSLGMVKKLVLQRNAGHGIAPLYGRVGRKPLITRRHEDIFRATLKARPGATLRELRDAAGLACSLTAVHNALRRMGVTFKKNAAGVRAGPARHRAGAQALVGEDGIAARGPTRVPRRVRG